jgi:hypothetical protein
MGCETCFMRKHYEKNPRSLLGRIWRWHTGFCPGWRGYLKGLTPEARAELDARLAEAAKK